MEVIQSGENVIIKDINDFNIHQIFTSGQTFRFDKIDGNTWRGIAFKRVINITQGEGGITLSPCSIDEFENIWRDFFDLDTDYGLIKKKLIDTDIRFKEMIEIGDGVRILRQDKWEMLITFIISANNNIPRIAKSVNCLCENYGEKIFIGDEFVGFAFPTPGKLANADLQALRSCGLGYRDKYIKETAKRVLEIGMPTSTGDELIRDLLAFKGVGRKVADCIRLFGYGCHDAFPVDTWIRKAQNELQGEFKNDNEVREQAFHIYGELSGIAQQYLFYYIRYIQKNN